MQNHWMLGLCGLAASIACTLTVWGHDARPETDGSAELPTPSPQLAISRFLEQNPGAEFFEIGGRITRVYGTAFGGGASAQEAANDFRLRHSGVFGVRPDDLIPVAWYEGGQHLQPIMFENGQPKFTGVNYTQTRDGVNVFRASLTMLVRNEPGFPVVLASSNLRDIGAFSAGPAAVNQIDARAGIAQARRMMPPGTIFEPAKPVIFAGVDEDPHAPMLAANFIGEGGDPLAGTYARREFVTDATTGQILYTEDLVCQIDVTGTVTGLVTDGYVAGACANENPQPLPYLRVSLGATNVWADANGAFTIPNAGSTDVTLNAPLIGQYFTVNNAQAPTSVVTQTATPGVPAAIVHNAANANEQTLAEVNAYRHANITRDMVLSFNPAFPTISTQSNFPVNVNSTAGTCNAFYSASTINFYLSGGGCNNTGFGTVVHHEYGHNVVAKAGSGQGAYGEGMGDVMGVLISENPITGIGFQNCGAGIRTANNTCQYQVSGCSSCGSEIHACGNLISGCIWNLRANLLQTNPATYRQLLGNLVINSMLVHSGSSINPAISIDYMVLDDNDANLANGTPHRSEIHNAFAAHNMAQAVQFTFPNGRPSIISPAGTTLLRVVLAAGTQTPTGATLNVDTGGGFVAVPMPSVAANTFEVAFPASSCATVVRYYVTGIAINAPATAVSPAGAPAVFYTAISAQSLGANSFNDNFQTDQGWSVTNEALLTGGAWERGTPVNNCSRGNPLTDGDGSGQCYLTQNSGGPVGDVCNTDIDGGATTLTSPNMNVTGPSILSYWRWYSNNFGSAPNADTMPIEISWNGGTNWQALETVGPVVDAGGGWVLKQWNLSSLPGYSLTNQLRIRFTAQDTGSGSVVEAGIDGVKIQQIICPRPGDTNGDGIVNVTDLLAVIGAWGPCPALPAPCPADVAPLGPPQGDGQINVTDLLMVIANWG